MDTSTLNLNDINLFLETLRARSEINSQNRRSGLG